MTRFARAKGSKASNERVPEEATSWYVMKEQMKQQKQESLENEKRKEFEVVRRENYKNFLDERENDVKSEWAEFDSSLGKRKQAKKKKNKIVEDSESVRSDPELNGIIGEIEKVLEKVESNNTIKRKNKKKQKVIDVNLGKGDDDDDAPEEVSAKVNVAPVIKKVKSKVPKSLPLKIPSVNTTSDQQIEKVNSNLSNAKCKVNKEPNGKSSKADKKNKTKSRRKDNNEINIPKVKKSVEDMTEDEIKRMNKKKAKRMRQLQNKKKFKAEQREKALKEQEEQNQNMKKRKLPKERDNEEHKRRKPDTQITTMNINGVEVNIDYVDGFPVKKEDAERLRKLRREMISKGIPRSEVQVALKLERRKAEKALAREKKKVCFNCRMSGHVLSECPNLNDNSQQEMTGTGICFKCGSTEHTHFDCKVVRNDDFRYATCFICRQQGHISRQCPDNQKGLYPKGGACKVCGDVTHLKKDCTKYQVEQESQTIKLDTLDDHNLEGLPEDKRGKGKLNKKTNKIVKF